MRGETTRVSSRQRRVPTLPAPRSTTPSSSWTRCVPSGCAQKTSPQSYGTLSHLCPSVAHESATRDALDEMPARRARRGPQPERAVDVEPGVRLAHDLDDLREAGRTSRCSPRRPARRRSSGRRARRAPRAARPAPFGPASSAGDDDELRRADPEQPQRAVDGHVAESPDDDADRRRLREPALANVPAALRREPRGVRRRVR